MTVICINNEGLENELRVNEQYEAFSAVWFFSYFSIENDKGEWKFYKKKRFISLIKHRQKILADLMK